MAQQPQSIDDAKYTVVSQGVAAQNPQPQITIDQNKYNVISQGVATNSFIPQELAYPKQQSTVSANAGQEYINATNTSIYGTDNTIHTPLIIAVYSSHLDIMANRQIITRV